MRSLPVVLVALVIFLVLASGVLADDTEGPRITLNAPDNGTTNYLGNATFNYRVVDSSRIVSCTLHLNSTSGMDLLLGDNTIKNNSQNTFKMDIPNGTWIWYVSCIDNATPANSNFSSNRTLFINLDTTRPTVGLFIPDTEADNTGLAKFYYNATDSQSGLATCSLYINDTLKTTIAPPPNNTKTSMTATLITGGYLWFVNCSDKAGNVGTSGPALLDVITEYTKPMITLNKPNSGIIDTDGKLTFNYTPMSSNKIITCVLLINGSVNQSDNNIEANEYNLFKEVTITDGSWNWSVNCTDNQSLRGNSSIRHFTVNTLHLITTYLQVALVSPINGLGTASSTNNFIYDVSAINAVSFCELITNGSIRAESNSITQNGQNEFLDVELSNGEWYWVVRCTDQAGNDHTSDVWMLNVGVPLVTENLPQDTPTEPEAPATTQNVSNDTFNQTSPAEGFLQGPFIIPLLTILLLVGFFGFVLSNEKAKKDLYKFFDMIRFKILLAPSKEKKDENYIRAKGYVKTYLDKGFGRSRIEKQLMGYGWEEKVVRSIFDDLEHEKQYKKRK